MTFHFKKKPACTCLALPEKPTSQDYNNRWLSTQKCPIHSKVADTETKRYEPEVTTSQLGAFYLAMKNQSRGMASFGVAFGVFQAVGLKQTGIKAFDTPNGWRAISSFPTKEDARRYLQGVLRTVRREQAMGIRSKENLDPKYSGGLDFAILPIIITTLKRPMAGRGWELSTAPAVDRRRKLTDNGKKDRTRKGKERAGSAKGRKSKTPKP